jgi:thiamine-phosphate pyrophosphorylase
VNVNKEIPRFVVILDRAGAKTGIAEVAAAAIRGGADVVQVREKDLNDEEVARIVESVVASTGAPNHVAVNSFPEVAAQFGTHLHLPEAFLFDRSATKLAPTACVSRSIHGSLTDLNVDYAILGNIWETGSKPGKPGLGLKTLEQIARNSVVPVLAIGGIEPANVRPILASGAYGVAVRSFVIEADDPEHAARAIKSELDTWTK